MDVQPSYSPDYAEYERLLLKLHDLMTQGKGDSEEADAIRDAMDDPWNRLTAVEAARASGLSAVHPGAGSTSVRTRAGRPARYPERGQGSLEPGRLGERLGTPPTDPDAGTQKQRGVSARLRL
jgi:hypothetical protein